MSLAVLLNLISWSHAISFFPRATFEENVSLVLQPRWHQIRSNPEDTSVADQAVYWQHSFDKYRDRGWDILQGLPRDGLGDGAFGGALPVGFRIVQDRHTWLLCLDTNNITSDLPKITSTWQLYRERRPTGYVPITYNSFDFLSNEDGQASLDLTLLDLIIPLTVPVHAHIELHPVIAQSRYRRGTIQNLTHQIHHRIATRPQLPDDLELLCRYTFPYPPNLFIQAEIITREHGRSRRLRRDRDSPDKLTLQRQSLPDQISLE